MVPEVLADDCGTTCDETESPLLVCERSLAKETLQGGAGGDDALVDGVEEEHARAHALVIDIMDRHSLQLSKTSNC